MFRRSLPFTMGLNAMREAERFMTSVKRGGRTVEAGLIPTAARGWGASLVARLVPGRRATAFSAMAPRSGSALRRAAVLTAVAAVSAGVLVPLASARADHDGPPALGGTGGLPFSPMTSPMAGNTPVRIYGSGFHGVTSVSFGGVPSPNVDVVDSNLILAVAPPAPEGTAPDSFVDVVVTDAQGSATATRAFFYTDATFTVSPTTGLSDGSSVTVNLSGYSPNTNVAVAEASPLAGFAEPRPTSLPPPQVDPLATGFTDAQGNLTQTVEVRAEPNFNTDGDPDAQCPPTQSQADAGLVTCSLAVSQFGRGSLAAPVTFANNPTPAPPTLALSASTVAPGQTVRLTGARWSANPNFGSSTSPTAPGETALTVEICGLGGNANACSAQTGTTRVALTRYINGVLSGAALTGSFVVGDDVAACTTCFVRVRQQVFGAVSGASRQATATMAVTGGVTTTTGATTTTTTTTCKPGYGHGDKKHCHSGPPGQDDEKKRRSPYRSVGGAQAVGSVLA